MHEYSCSNPREYYAFVQWIGPCMELSPKISKLVHSTAAKVKYCSNTKGTYIFTRDWNIGYRFIVAPPTKSKGNKNCYRGRLSLIAIFEASYSFNKKLWNKIKHCWYSFFYIHVLDKLFAIDEQWLASTNSYGFDLELYMQNQTIFSFLHYCLP